MKRLLFPPCLTVLLMLVMSTAVDAQAVHFDPCSLATFRDEAKGKEHGQLLTKLSYEPRHNAAQRELAKLGESFVARPVGAELFSWWNDLFSQIQEAVRAPEVAEAQVVLAEHCLNRLKESRETETEYLRMEIQHLRTLLALPDAELSARYKARWTAIFDAYGTPEAANQTLRITLGLPVPH